MAQSSRVRANKRALASYIGAGIIPGGGGGRVIRALGNGMATTIEAAEPGTVWSRLTRSRHVSFRKFKRSRVVIPTTYFTGSTPMVETDWPASLKFRVSLEPVFFEGLTGIPARSLTYLVGASKDLLYNGPGSNPTKVLRSDWLDHVEIPANQAFGLWTNVENQLGASSPANSLPYTWPSSSFVNRNEGGRNNTAQDGGISYIDANATETRTSVSAWSNSRDGSASGFVPAFLEVEDDAGAIFVFDLGDSMTAGVGAGRPGPDGTSTPAVIGDASGNQRRARGYPNVAMDTLGINHVNAGKGSDGFKNLSVDGNMTARLEYIRFAKPPFILVAEIFNDAATNDATFLTQVDKVYGLLEAASPGVKIIQTTAVPWTLPQRDVTSLTYSNAANLATVTVASTADLVQGQTVTMTGATPSGLNVRAPINITSGTTFTYSPPAALGADATATGTIKYNSEFRSLVGQAINGGAGSVYDPANGANSRASKNRLVRARSGPFARCFAIYDPCLVCESGFTGSQASETGLWQVDPNISFKWTWDGFHQNNSGQQLLGQNLAQVAQAQGWFQ